MPLLLAAATLVATGVGCAMWVLRAPRLTVVTVFLVALVFHAISVLVILGR